MKALIPHFQALLWGHGVADILHLPPGNPLPAFALFAYKFETRNRRKTSFWDGRFMKNSVISSFLGLILVANVTAQTLTSVSVIATDPVATEPGAANFPDTGTFTITRSGPTNMPLTVAFTLEGTAINGVDYEEVPAVIGIPEGQRSARVFIVPRVDDLREGDERVILRIAPSPMTGPGSGYILPTNSIGAMVTIRDAGTNAPPANTPPNVQIVRPANGEVFRPPADIGIVANTVDPDGWVPTVEFFANGAKIGESTINFIVQPPDGTPITHEFKWQGVGAGEYFLTARATDDQGATRTSLGVRISVTDSNVPPLRTVVSVFATDPEGREIPEVPPGMERPQLIDPAIFTVTRSGSLSNDLTVYYRLGGTASNGVDYVELPSEVKIPAGARSTQVEINVLDDQLVEGTEGVSIQILPPVCIEIFPPPPECYVVAPPGRADARILDDDFAPSNRPPVVTIIAPTNGAVFKAPADIGLMAYGFDSDGYVQTVEFFEGTNSLGIATNNPFVANIMPPFQLKWSNVPAGEYVLTALATDNGGAKSLSRPVRVAVIDEPIRQTVVNIRAVDPDAAEQSPFIDSLPNTGLLRVTRSGPTDFDLEVYYDVSGTAGNGVDYRRLGGSVLIPKGAESADLAIEAIDDNIAEPTESVIVSVTPPVCIRIYPPPPECYLVGPANRAMAFILDDDRFETNNFPPRVEITRPANGATFRAPADIHIVAKTVDRDGYVGRVEFFANNHKIGEASKEFLVPPPDGSVIEYEFNWSDVRPGAYALTARAIDDSGARGLSAPVRILVTGTNTPPPTNVAVVTVAAIDAHASETPNIFGTNGPPYDATLVTDTNGIIRPPANTATFEIRRTGGNLSLPLRVFYETHGTATEGVDYLDLPGVAEIPAGSRAARVVVWPIDDRLPEKLESVVLCLRPSPLLGPLPGYVIGRPGHAGAVIADNDTPRLPYTCLSDGVFHLCQPAADGRCFRIECSTDLKDWTVLDTVTATEGAVQYVDPDGGAYDRRFYRTVPVPCPVEP